MALGILCLSLTTPETSQAQKVSRIGYLSARSPADDARLEAFRQVLRHLGHIEGTDLIIETRWAEGRHDRLAELAADLVHRKVDVIVAATTPPALAAKNATSTIPVVFLIIADPVAQGFVSSLARPGGNATGLSSVSGTELYGKQLQLLREAFPGIHRVAVLWNPDSPFGRLVLQETESAARDLRVQIVPRDARSAAAFDGVFAAIVRDRVDALIVVPDQMFILHRAQLAALATKHRLPAMYGIREHVEAGGLMSYSADFVESYRRAAVFVDKILKGTKPADLPVEQPTKFELVVNITAARSLGWTVPLSLVPRVDQFLK